MDIGNFKSQAALFAAANTIRTEQATEIMDAPKYTGFRQSEDAGAALAKLAKTNPLEATAAAIAMLGDMNPRGDLHAPLFRSQPSHTLQQSQALAYLLGTQEGVQIIAESPDFTKSLIKAASGENLQKLAIISHSPAHVGVKANAAKDLVGALMSKPGQGTAQYTF